MKVFIVILFVALITYSGNCQKQLSLAQGSWGIKYYADGVRINRSEFDALIIQKDPSLYYEYKNGKSNVDFANVLGFAGGFMIGWNIGNLITGRSKKFTLGGAGLGVILITIPLQSSGYRKMSKVISVYNSSP